MFFVIYVLSNIETSDEGSLSNFTEKPRQNLSIFNEHRQNFRESHNYLRFTDLYTCK